MIFGGKLTARYRCSKLRCPVRRQRGLRGGDPRLSGSGACLLDSAELLGLLLGLSAQWVAAGFAPPVVLLTLSQSAPRILELGAGLTTELTAG